MTRDLDPTASQAPSAPQTTVGEDEALLGARDRERLQLARTIFGDMWKALKALRLYMGKGPHVERFRADLARDLGAWLLEHGPLKVEVTPYALTWLGHAVLETDGGESEDLVYELFAEGFREIGFYQGLPEEELGILLDILATDLRGPDRAQDEDRVTLLWRAGLLHVGVVTADVFSSGAFFARHTEYRDRFVARVQQMLDRGAARLAPNGLVAPRGDPPAGRRTPLGLDPILGGFPGFGLRHALAAPRKDVESMATLLGSDEEPTTTARLVEICMELAARRPTLFDLERTSEQVVRRLEDLLFAGDLDSLAQVCHVFREHALVRDDRREARRAFLRKVFTGAARYHRLILLRPILLEGRKKDMDRLMSFFELIPRQDLDGVGHLLAKMGETPAAHDLRAFLERSGADLTAYHVSRLRHENVLVTLDALKSLANTWTEGAEDAIRGMLDNRNPSVRRQAMLSLKGRWNEHIFAAVLRVLQSDEVQLRLAALEVAAAAHDPDLAAPLATIADNPEFSRRDADERRQHVITMVRCDPAQGLAWTDRQLGRRGLLSRKRTAPLQEASVLALSALDTPEARARLEAWISAEPVGNPLRALAVRTLSERDAAEAAQAEQEAGDG